jgi:hypothetical protein
VRTRLLPAALGLVLLVSGSMVLAAPAQAASVPTPVDITTPLAVPTSDALDIPATGHYGVQHAVQPFVADRSGPLHSMDARIGAPAGTSGVSVAVYSEDQLSFTPQPGLTRYEQDDLYLGTPIGSTTTDPISPDGTGRGEFDSAGQLVAGITYRAFLTNAYGLAAGASLGLPMWWRNGTKYQMNGYELALRFNVVGDHPVRVDLDPATPNGSDGWYTSPVTTTYTCADGVTDCPANATIDADGTHVPSGTVTAGDDPFAWFHTLKVDRTKPTVTGTAAPHGTGFRVTWTCADATSGIDTCPEPVVVSGVGEDTVATAVASDVAGNTTTGTVTGLVGSAHPPTLTISGVTPGKTYAHGTTVTPTCTTTGTRPSAPALTAPSITCTGTSTAKNNADGSVTWTYTATAVDTDPLGGTTTKSVSWRIAAKPVPVVKPAPKPKPTKKKVATVIVKGLPKATKNGHAVIDHRKSYDISFVFKTKNGTTLKGKPTWLHSVKTNKKGTQGKPTKKLNEFTKVDGVWKMHFTPGYHYEGQYRKFGVVAPNGKRYYFVIYVK